MTRNHKPSYLLNILFLNSWLLVLYANLQNDSICFPPWSPDPQPLEALTEERLLSSKISLFRDHHEHISPCSFSGSFPFLCFN